MQAARASCNGYRWHARLWRQNYQHAVLRLYDFFDAVSFHLNAGKLNDLCVLRDFIGNEFFEFCNRHWHWFDA